MNEDEWARKLANDILDQPSRDPDDDLSTLARQLLRADEKVETLRTVRDQAFKWLALHARCSPQCASRQPQIVPDGAYRSGLCKDYGGRYSREGERGLCDCGLNDLRDALCQSTTAAPAEAETEGAQS